MEKSEHTERINFSARFALTNPLSVWSLVLMVMFRCYNSPSVVASGREDSALILLHRSGSLSIKILQRKADLSVCAFHWPIYSNVIQTTPISVRSPLQQDAQLSIPAVTHLLFDQMSLEKDGAVEMHQAFLGDLSKMKLKIAHNYIKVKSFSKWECVMYLAESQRRTPDA